MGWWNRKEHDDSVRDAVLDEDWDRVQRLADEAVQHDKDVARQTGYIAWKHKNAG